MKKTKIISKGPYLVDECYRGAFTEKSSAIVMDNTFSRQHNKRKVAYFITENTTLLAGQNTVALFKIKKH